jgi:threonine/homoserine/homoserine lactone efflux protein
MPQFITHDRPLPEQFILMYITVAVIVALVHTIYSVSVRRIHSSLRTSRWLGVVKRGSGVVFFALGIKLLMAKRA